MAGSFVRREDNSRKPTPFRCSIVCEIYSPSGDAFLSPALSISAPIFLETLGACPLVCGSGARRKSVAASGGRNGRIVRRRALDAGWRSHRVL